MFAKFAVIALVSALSFSAVEAQADVVCKRETNAVIQIFKSAGEPVTELKSERVEGANETSVRTTGTVRFDGIVCEVNETVSVVTYKGDAEIVLKARSMKDSVVEGISKASEKVGETVEKASEKVGETVDKAKRKAEEYFHRASDFAVFQGR